MNNSEIKSLVINAIKIWNENPQPHIDLEDRFLSFIALSVFENTLEVHIRTSLKKKDLDALEKELKNIPEFDSIESVFTGMAGNWIHIKLNIDWRNKISKEDWMKVTGRTAAGPAGNPENAEKIYNIIMESGICHGAFLLYVDYDIERYRYLTNKYGSYSEFFQSNEYVDKYARIKRA